jgi:hypothetical protein
MRVGLGWGGASDRRLKDSPAYRRANASLDPEALALAANGCGAVELRDFGHDAAWIRPRLEMVVSKETRFTGRPTYI